VCRISGVGCQVRVWGLGSYSQRVLGKVFLTSKELLTEKLAASADAMARELLEEEQGKWGRRRARA